MHDTATPLLPSALVTWDLFGMRCILIRLCLILEFRALCVSWYPDQISPLEIDLGKSMSLPQSLEKLPEDFSVEVEEFEVMILTLWKTQD
ncbi:hypothetical protein Tco_1469825 [Tanacetum coccineum]